MQFAQLYLLRGQIRLDSLSHGRFWAIGGRDTYRSHQSRIQIAQDMPFVPIDPHTATLASMSHLPRVAQRAALSAKGASRARSMLALFPGKGSEISLPASSRRVRKDAFKPDS